MEKIKDKSFYRHKMEIPLYVIYVVVSFVIFIILSYLGYMATLGSEANNIILQYYELDSEFAETVMRIGGYISIVVIVLLILCVINKYEDSKLKAKAHDVHVASDQFPMLIEAEKEYAKKLGIKKLPKIYISKEKNELELFGSLVLDDPNTIRIPCEELIVSAEKDYCGAKVAIAKHLASIYLGYYNPFLFLLTIFSRWVPILNNAFNRATVYSTDKLVADLVGKDTVIDSIIEQTIDIWFLEYVNVDAYLKNTENVVKDKYLMWENMVRDVPISPYRIDALMNNKDGKLF